jgi:hypothetical protein
MTIQAPKPQVPLCFIRNGDKEVPAYPREEMRRFLEEVARQLNDIQARLTANGI